MKRQNSPLFVVLGLVACLTPLSTRTQAAAAGDYRPLAREIFRELIEIKTTDSGVGSTPAAEAVAQRLRAAGFPEADIQVIGPSARKKNVVARLCGSFFFSSRRRHTRFSRDWSSDVCSSDLNTGLGSDVGKGSITVIMIKDGAAVAG